MHSSDLEADNHEINCNTSGADRNHPAAGHSVTISNPVYEFSELSNPIDNPMYAKEQDKRELYDLLCTDTSKHDRVVNNPLYYSEIVSEEEAKESYSYAALHTAANPKVHNHNHHRISSPPVPIQPQPEDRRELSVAKTHLRPGISSSYVLLGPDESEERNEAGICKGATAASDHCQVVSPAKLPVSQRGRCPASVDSRASNSEHHHSVLGNRFPEIAAKKPDIPPKPTVLVGSVDSPLQSSVPSKQADFCSRAQKLSLVFSRSQSTRTSSDRHTTPAYAPIRYRKVKDNRLYSVSYLKASDDYHEKNRPHSSVNSPVKSMPKRKESDC